MEHRRSRRGADCNAVFDISPELIIEIDRMLTHRANNIKVYYQLEMFKLRKELDKRIKLLEDRIESLEKDHVQS